jgi:PAS domain S-box-containing protein
MTDVEGQGLEMRVLVLPPTAKDADLTRSVLGRAGVTCVCCRDLGQLCDELEKAAGAVMLPEEAVSSGQSPRLRRWLARQPPWSDLPVLVLAGPGADSSAVSQAVDLLGNVTVLERPTRVAALVSAVRTALRARRRQYQIRDHLAEQERNLEAKGLLAAIVSSSDDVIISKTLDGNILTWNAGAEHLFGYTAAEVVGKPITILIPPERQAEEPAFLEKLRRGEPIEHFETVRVTKDGRRLDISLTVSPVRDETGRIIGASKVARDITESKRAADALRAAQEQLQLVTDNMAVAVTRCSRDFRYLWVSRGAAAFLARRAEEIVGRPIRDVLGAAAFEAIRPHLERVLTGERVEVELQIPYQHLGPRWVRAVYVPTHDRSGQTDGWVAVVVDTTAHHKMEESLREADRRKDEFLAVLAHELRNPLAPIRNSLHILRLSSQHDPTAERVGEIMERQVNHMVRLVDDLMEVSRITRGKIELRKEPIEVAAFIRSAVETSRPLIEAGGHQLAVTLPPEPLTLEGDPVRLTQVVANLLNNAAKYTDPGGQIWLKVRREDDRAVISVRDNGLGIRPDMLPRVFELFTQIDRHAGRSNGGLGIGLTLVKSLVEMHGGTVVAHSDGVGRGSEFVIRLPLAPAAAAAGHPEAEIRPSTVLAARRVLVVDDHRDSAQSLGMLLKLLGADVQVVYSGPDALEAMAKYKPVAVLLDIGMPGMDGHEVARRIRQQPEYRDVTLIALTGWGQEDDRRRSKTAGFDFHLVKPADVSALQTLLISLDDRKGPETRGPDR